MIDNEKNLRWLGDHLDKHAENEGIWQGSEGARYCWLAADEIATLKQQLEEANLQHKSDLRIAHLQHSKIVELQQQNAELLKDTERYRYHRSIGGKSWHVVETGNLATGELYDAATDAAIASAEGK